jgi:hypothetical protein
MALIKRKLTYAIKAPRNFGKRQNRIQKKRLFLFPDLQETVDAPVVLEFMKISPSNLQNSTQKRAQEKLPINAKIPTIHHHFYKKKTQNLNRGFVNR